MRVSCSRDSDCLVISKVANLGEVVKGGMAWHAQNFCSYLSYGILVISLLLQEGTTPGTMAIITLVLYDCMIIINKISSAQTRWGDF